MVVQVTNAFKKIGLSPPKESLSATDGGELVIATVTERIKGLEMSILKPFTPLSKKIGFTVNANERLAFDDRAPDNFLSILDNDERWALIYNSLSETAVMSDGKTSFKLNSLTIGGRKYLAATAWSYFNPSIWTSDESFRDIPQSDSLFLGELTECLAKGEVNLHSTSARAGVRLAEVVANYFWL